MTGPTFRDETPWYRFLLDQILSHGWELLTDFNAIGIPDDVTETGTHLVEFRYPDTTAILELTYPWGVPDEQPNLTLTYPFDPSFGERRTNRDREPFVWALGNAHETVVRRYTTDRTSVFDSPDVVLSADVPLAQSRETMQETLLGITLSTIAIRHLHESLYRTIDQYRDPADSQTLEEVISAFGFEDTDEATTDDETK